MKRLFRLLILVVILIVVGGIAFVSYVDGVARSAVEEAATESLGVKTTLADMNVGILDANCTLDGLRIANPEGFAGDDFLRMRQGHIDVNLSTLMDDVVEIPELTFDGVDLNVVLDGDRGNYDVILDRMKGDSAGTEGERRYIVRDLRIRDINVSATLSPLAAVSGSTGSLVKLKVPEIHLEDIGSESDGGVVLSQLGDVVVQALLAAISQGGLDLPRRLLDDLKSGLIQLPGFAELDVDLVGDVDKLLEESLGGAGKALDDATKKIGDLFGK